MVSAVALVPFVQSMATQGGVRVAERVRRRRLRRTAQHPGPDSPAYLGARSILVVEDGTDVSFPVPGGLPTPPSTP